MLLATSIDMCRHDGHTKESKVLRNCIALKWKIRENAWKWNSEGKGSWTMWDIRRHRAVKNINKWLDKLSVGYKTLKVQKIGLIFLQLPISSTYLANISYISLICCKIGQFFVIKLTEGFRNF